MSDWAKQRLQTDQNYLDIFEYKYELSTFESWSIKQHANPITNVLLSLAPFDI